MEWVHALRDDKVRAIVAARIRRLAHGLPGDVAPVGQGVSELRMHVGAGWRVYFKRHGKSIVVLLAGGSERTQQQDMARALALAAQLPAPDMQEPRMV